MAGRGMLQTLASDIKYLRTFKISTWSCCAWNIQLRLVTANGFWEGSDGHFGCQKLKSWLWNWFLSHLVWKHSSQYNLFTNLKNKAKCPKPGLLALKKHFSTSYLDKTSMQQHATKKPQQLAYPKNQIHHKTPQHS